MILQNLLGLWILLSVPILIIIYIIKQEHKERAVSSTYLWRLSVKYLKKRLPIRRMTRLLAFLLQLTILALLAFSAAQPAMAVGSISAHIVVIDASAGMQTELDGVSRFDAAVAEVKALAESGLCSSMTVIVASDTPACPVMGGTAGEALEALEDLTCGWGGCDIYDTMKLVREAYTRMGSAKVTFYTDKEYAEVENVTVKDMRRDEKNVAITAFTHVSGDFDGTLVSYGEDRAVTVGLYVEDVIVDTKTVSCVNGEPAKVSFDTDITAFKKATLRIDLEDALEADNSFSVMGKKADMASVLVLGEETVFFEAGFAALGNCEVTVKDTYDPSDDGKYDLYIFSGCVPTEEDILPKDRTVIGFMQLPEGTEHGSVNVHGNILLGGISAYTVPFDSYMKRFADQKADPLFEGTEELLPQVYIGQGLRLRSSSLLDEWSPVCLNENRSTDTCWRRETASGHAHYLFPFPMSESNLAMTPAFMQILENAVAIAAPPVIPKTQYTVGEQVSFSLKDGAASPTVTDERETVTELSVRRPLFVPSTPGAHTLTYELNGIQREASFFVHLSPDAYETYSAETIFLSKDFEREVMGEQLTSSAVPTVALILLALLIFEWGYHYRGKY